MQGLLTQKQLSDISAGIHADTLRRLQESEGRIPLLTQRQAQKGYGRSHVEAWVREGRLTPIRKGKVGLFYRHSDLERCLGDDRLLLGQPWLGKGGAL
jgi:hypothetical protein